jgi:hypothetical protein
MNSINFNNIEPSINPWIGLPLSVLILAIAYTIMHKAMNNPSYEWKAKKYVGNME